MNFDSIRLMLGVLWLGVAIVVVVRPAGLGQRLDGENGGLIMVAALALAAWNLSRWYFTRPTPAVGPRPLRGRGNARTEEYNPELDFTKKDL